MGEIGTTFRICVRDLFDIAHAFRDSAQIKSGRFGKKSMRNLLSLATI
jgi:hypothetical protein